MMCSCGLFVCYTYDRVLLIHRTNPVKKNIVPPRPENHSLRVHRGPRKLQHREHARDTIRVVCSPNTELATTLNTLMASGEDEVRKRAIDFKVVVRSVYPPQVGEFWLVY